MHNTEQDKPLLCSCTEISLPAGKPCFGQCSPKEDYKSTRASTPSLLSSRAKVILLDFERETKRKNIIPSTQLSSDPWVWHLPDGQGAFFGFAWSTDVPKPTSDCRWWKASFGRALQQPWAYTGGGCCHNNLKKQQRSSSRDKPFHPCPPLITCRDDTEFQTEELIIRLTQLHLMWPLLSVDKERTMRFLLSWESLQPAFLWLLLHIAFPVTEVSDVFSLME